MWETKLVERIELSNQEVIRILKEKGKCKYSDALKRTT